MTQTDITKAEELKASTVRLPESMWAEAQHLAVDQRCSFNDVLTEALTDYLAKRRAAS